MLPGAWSVSWSLPLRGQVVPPPPPQDEVLNALHWVRQAYGVGAGLLFGLLGVTGAAGAIAYLLSCFVLTTGYVLWGGGWVTSGGGGSGGDGDGGVRLSGASHCWDELHSVPVVTHALRTLCLVCSNLGSSLWLWCALRGPTVLCTALLHSTCGGLLSLPGLPYTPPFSRPQLLSGVPRCGRRGPGRRARRRELADRGPLLVCSPLCTFLDALLLPHTRCRLTLRGSEAGGEQGGARGPWQRRVTCCGG